MPTSFTMLISLAISEFTTLTISTAFTFAIAVTASLKPPAFSA